MFEIDQYKSVHVFALFVEVVKFILNTVQTIQKQTKIISRVNLKNWFLRIHTG